LWREEKRQEMKRSGWKDHRFRNPGARRGGLGQNRPGGISGKSHGGDGEEGKKRLQSDTQTRGEDTMHSCSVAIKHLNIDPRYTFKEGEVYINGIEGFWSFAKERLIKHGISRHTFLYDIREMEGRYSNRGKDLFEDLVN